MFKEGAANTPMKEFAFPGPNETKGYELFPKYLENDPLVLFHGTAKKNLESILKDGFKAFPPLSSVSYAKSSVYCLTHLCPNGASQEDNVVIAVRFETLKAQGIQENNSDIHVYKSDLQPQIIGYCTVPLSYRHI